MTQQRSRRSMLAIAALITGVLACAQPAQRLPNVTIIATGGTIAGEAATSVQSAYTFRSGWEWKH